MLQAATASNEGKQLYDLPFSEPFPKNLADYEPIRIWSQATLGPEAGRMTQELLKKEQRVSAISVALIFHYLNPMMEIFTHPNFNLIPNPNGMTRPMRHMVVFRMAPNARDSSHPQGASLRLGKRHLGAKLPKEFSFAKGDPQVSEAFARWSAVVDAIEIEAASQWQIPKVAIDFVKTKIGSWEGDHNAQFRGSLQQELADRFPNDLRARAAARLAVLTAIAPEQIDPAVISEFQKFYGKSDSRLAGWCAWAAHLRIRRIGGWLSQSET